MMTSADIEDGKTEYDAKTGVTTKYRKIEGGYEMVITTPQPNGTVKTTVKTFWDPKPMSEEDLKKEMANKKVVQSRMGKEIRIDSKTTMLTRAIEGGYEEVYTTINEDGTKSMQTKTFYDSVPEGTPFPGQQPKQTPPPQQQQQQLQQQSQKRVIRNSSMESTDSIESQKLVQKINKQQLQQTQTRVTRNSSIESTDSIESQKLMQKVNKQQQQQQQQQQQISQISQKSNVQVQQSQNLQKQSTFEESRHYSENIEYMENNRTVRKNSVQEQSIKSISSSTVTDGSNMQKLKKTKKPKSAIPPPPPDFVQNDTTRVQSKRVPGGTEYTYTTQLESGKTITTSKIVYEEEESELTEEEVQQYKKTLKDAEKHKNITTTKKLKSESGTKKVVPSENPGDVTTVETIRISGGTEYHYTTVTAEGIVKKAIKTVYDPICTQNSEDIEEQEIVEDYEEEIIEPGEKNVRTVETVKKLPQQFQEEVTIMHEKKEKKIKKSMIISQ